MTLQYSKIHVDISHFEHSITQDLNDSPSSKLTFTTPTSSLPFSLMKFNQKKVERYILISGSESWKEHLQNYRTGWIASKGQGTAKPLNNGQICSCPQIFLIRSMRQNVSGRWNSADRCTSKAWFDLRGCLWRQKLWHW